MQKKGTYLFQMRRRRSAAMVTAGDEEREQAVGLAENAWRANEDWDTFRVILALKGYDGQENYAIVRDWLEPDGGSTIRTCGSLKNGESVVFSIYDPLLGCRMACSGNVLENDHESGKVRVLLDDDRGGRNTDIEEVAYSDMLTVYNEKGVYFDFGRFGGQSDLLMG